MGVGVEVGTNAGMSLCMYGWGYRGRCGFRDVCRCSCRCEDMRIVNLGTGV